jgi:hypothetical protein
VDEAVVAAAEEDEVREAGLAALGPMSDVVAVDEAAVLAAGEAAASVADSQRAADGGGDRATEHSPGLR